MKKINATDPESHSADLVAQNLEQLRTLFPEAFTEGKVNFEILKQLLGEVIDDREEKYGLSWHGKRRARQLALISSTGTLRPCPDESLDWDTTQNLMIEGDNLEVLKLLQKSYAGKVKLICIDPPYNTGKDFVYRDDYRDNIKNYLELTGQVTGGAKISSNTEAGGRFHTEWLNMMYPRLRVARNLLRDDGAVFISIDDGEVDHLKRLCCEIFGEENFVGIISVLVNPRGRHLDRFIAKTHDQLVVFVKNAENRKSIRGLAKEGAMLEEYDKEDDRGKYRELGLRNRNQAFNPTTRPNLYFPLYVDPATGRISLERSARFCDKVMPDTPDGTKTCWTWGKDKVASDNELLIARKADDGWRIYRKDYLQAENGDLATTLAKSLWLEKEFNNDYGRKSVKELFGAPIMDFPKSPELMQRIVAIGSGPEDIVIDFFAGSATTAHGVMAQNAADEGERRYVMVQLPEPLDPQVKEQKAAADFCRQLERPMNLVELTKERLRRAAAKIKKETRYPGDLGFRVFRLDSTNINEWAPKQNLDGALQSSIEHLKMERTEQDLLYELLLKLGLELCVPIERKSISKKEVHAVAGGVLMVCLAQKIATKEIEGLALGIVEWHKSLAPAGEVTCVFRDSAFEDDVAKTNMAAILEQHGLKNVRSL